MPAIDPYLGALAAFGRAARGGAGSVMAHYTRFHTPEDPVDEARAVASAAAEVGVRVTLAVFMRDRNPLVYGPSEDLLDKLPEASRAALRRASWRRRRASRRRSRASRRSPRRWRARRFSVQFGPNGPQWCSDELLAAIAAASARTGRRIHMHFLETRYQRAFADEHYPEGVAARLEALGLLSPRLTLAHCVYAREEELDAIVRNGVTIATNPSSNLHLRSGIAPIGEAIRRGARVALGVDASAFDEDDDILREMRLGAFPARRLGLRSGVSREDWLAAIVANGRRANGAPGSGALEVGEPADVLVLDLDRLDRDAVMPVEPIDYCSRARPPRISTRSMLRAAQIVADGRLDRRRSRGGRDARCARNIASACPRAPAFCRLGRRSPEAVAGCYGCC